MFDFARFREDYLHGKIEKKAIDRWNEYNTYRQTVKQRDDKLRELWEAYLKVKVSPDIRHTIYCSTIAHLRGKLHMNCADGYTLLRLDQPVYRMKQSERKTRLLDEVRQIYKWTLEDQAKLAEPLIKEYQIPTGSISHAEQMMLHI